MSDYSELKRLAESATPGTWEVDETRQVFAKSAGEYVALTKIEDFNPIPFDQGAKDAEFIAAANPAAVLALIAENEALHRQVKALQSDANSWQSGYDEGRSLGAKHMVSENESTRRQVETLSEWYANALNENEALRKDAERLEWFISSKAIISEFEGSIVDRFWLAWPDTQEQQIGVFESPRAAIDEAMSKESE